MLAPPYREYWTDTVELHTKPRTFVAELTMSEPDDAAAELTFLAGGDLAAAAPFRICIGDVALESRPFERFIEAAPNELPRVRANQLGYLPQAGKRATWVSDASETQTWELLNATGARVATGRTRVHGLDAASGESVHVIDFSMFQAEGVGYRLRVGADTSRTFDIRTDVYDQLRYAALAFFFHQRSGIELAMPFAGDARWARPPGHLADHALRCGTAASCDVSGGWYDAGNYVKSVVNAGIAVWTLLHQYERAVRAATTAAIGDGRLSIPEAENGVPDLLDEIRWELEFLLEMQVPPGEALSGAVHHAVASQAKTALGRAPHEDAQPRVLQAPSTAATLNLAAVAALAARVYSPIDSAFSARCLEAAQRAFEAAERRPTRYVPAAEAPNESVYADGDVRDEWYWAAAELWITTGHAKYRERLQPWAAQPIVPTTLVRGAGDTGQNGVFTWQNVAAAGAMSLALAPDWLPDERSWARREIARAADALLAVRAREGYSVPFAPGAGPNYPSGSNAFVLNNAIALAFAYEFTHDRKYLDGVVSAMDYLLGNNALDRSYITGFGARPVEHPHHAFFARVTPPPGIATGGANSAADDPIARGAGVSGRPPQRCFFDHVESYSTNQVSISWNASLAWIAAFLADTAHGP